jgi:putative ABC transport system substrate-binding protein
MLRATSYSAVALNRRRKLLIALGAGMFTPVASLAQQVATRIPRVGFLGNSTAVLESNLIGPFREGLRDLGYVEGQNIFIEYRWAEGKYERFPQLIAELLALKVDVIVTAGTPAALAVKRATATVPVVMVAVGDPVGTGLVASLARPGGNLTGLTSIAPDLEGKRLELLLEVVPKLSQVAFVLNPSNAFHVASEKQARDAAKLLHVNVRFVPIRTDAEFDRAFDTIISERPSAFIVLADRVFLHNRARIVDFAARTHLPAVYPYVELVEEGGLMSFGPNYADMHRRAANYVDKVLKGATPGDLPVELPTKFELVINMKTARSLGIKIPQSVLLRADKVIQ